MKNIIENWNYFDRIIFAIEKIVTNIHKHFIEAADPDVETMILAETEHIRKENEQLKKKQFPLKLQYDNENYVCPDCKNIIKPLLIEDQIKHCPECGRRVFHDITKEIAFKNEIDHH